MLQTEVINYLKDKAENIIGFRFDGEVIPVDKECVYVEYTGGNKVEISAGNKTFFMRSYALFLNELKNKEEKISINQTPSFKKLGVMLDCSRNAVFLPEAVKRYIDKMAVLGFNLLELYMEDTYELKDYPYFGYMRGRYTKEELKEIDDYAYSLGVELVPSIQVLGHMEQYLKWPAASAVKDTNDVLLVGAKETYAFIEAMFKFFSETLRTRNINVNVDEAFSLGQGQYKALNGERSKRDILMEHLNKVKEIADKYNMRMKIGNDFLYCQVSDSDFLYSLKEVDTEKLSDFPKGVDIYTWGYDIEEYDQAYEYLRVNKVMNDHLGLESIYLGGIHTWNRILPNPNYSRRVMKSKIKACLELGYHQLHASVWGDDGAECNMEFSSQILLPLFSEYCYLGKECTDERVDKIIEEIVGFDVALFDVFAVASDPYDSWQWVLENYGVKCGSYKNLGRRMLYSDILYNTSGYFMEYIGYDKKYKESAENVKKAKCSPYWDKYIEFASHLYETISEKTEFTLKIRDAYTNKKTETLNRLANELLPSLKAKYEKLHIMHRKLWLGSHKPFGWESLEIRYGGAIARIDYAIYRINEYLDGNVDSLPEIEFEFIDEAGLYKSGNYFQSFYPSLIH